MTEREQIADLRAAVADLADLILMVAAHSNCSCFAVVQDKTQAIVSATRG